MKSISSITILLIAIVYNSYAQQQFEGKIIYEMSFPAAMDLNPQTKNVEPKEVMVVTMFLKGYKMRMETLTLLNNNISFFDAKSKTAITLVDLQGKKTAVLMDKEEMEEGAKHNSINEKHKIILLDETKKIAGYNCKKIEVILDEKRMEKLIIYYTDKIKSDAINKNPNWIQARHKDISGLVLEYKIEIKKEVIYSVTAKQVSIESITDDNFTIPTDYKKVNQEKAYKVKK